MGFILIETGKVLMKKRCLENRSLRKILGVYFVEITKGGSIPLSV